MTPEDLISFSKEIFPDRAEHPAPISELRELFSSLSVAVSEKEKEIGTLKTRERDLVRILTTKEICMRRLKGEIRKLEHRLENDSYKERGQYVDPWINENFRKLQQELEETRKNLQTATDELSSAKFSPESTTGRQLMIKCRKLQEENEELGRKIAESDTNKIAQKLQFQRDLNNELTETLRDFERFTNQQDADLKKSARKIGELNTTNQELVKKLERSGRATPLSKDSKKAIEIQDETDGVEDGEISSDSSVCFPSRVRLESTVDMDETEH